MSEQYLTDSHTGHVEWRPRLGCFSVWVLVGGAGGRMEIEIARVEDIAEGSRVIDAFQRTRRYRTVYARRQCPDARRVTGRGSAPDPAEAER